MATIPTQNAVPSEAAKDLKFNSGKIDEFVTSMKKKYIDRFGQEHFTIEGLRWVAQQAISQFGYITLDSFQKGAEITLPNQVLRDEATGEYYRWDGELPKSVPAGSTPESTGGIGLVAWVSVGDASLREQLLSHEGADKIGYGGVTVSDIIGLHYVYLEQFGFKSGDDITDLLPKIHSSYPKSSITCRRGSEIVISKKTQLLGGRTYYFPDCKIKWVGDKVDLTNKDNKRNNYVLAIIDQGMTKITGFPEIDVNDWGVGLHISDSLFYAEVKVKNSQCTGVDISNSRGLLESPTLTDCAALSDIGYSITDLEGWSDGIHVWYGSGQVIINNPTVISKGGRSGRCGIVAEGYFPVGGVATSNVIINNPEIRGYDRPFHTELTGHGVVVNGGTIEYRKAWSNHAWIKSAVANWNVLSPTVYNQTHFISDDTMIYGTGGEGVFNDCKFSHSGAGLFFRITLDGLGKFLFNGGSVKGGATTFNFYNGSFTFDGTKVECVNSIADVYNSSELIIRNESSFTGVSFTTRNGTNESIKVTDSFIDSDSKPLTVNKSAKLYLGNAKIPKGVNNSSKTQSSYIELMYGDNPELINIDYYALGNKTYVGLAKPTVGNGFKDYWKYGEKVYKRDPFPGTPLGWVCVEEGGPGTWAPLPNL